MECWLSQTDCFCCNNTAIVPLYVNKVTRPIRREPIYKDPLKVTIFHKNKRTLINL